MTNKYLSWYALLNDMEKELEGNKEEILASDEILHEYVERWIPVYNYDLICYLHDHPDLSEVDDEGLLPENPGVHDIIRCAMYEQLSQHAYEWLNKAQEESESEDE